MTRPFRRCGHAPGAIAPEDQAVVNEFLAMLAARKRQPATPGNTIDDHADVSPSEGGDAPLSAALKASAARTPAADTSTSTTP
ncbi:hypothetical protein [Streptomyces avermitilis]|uniref:hypothetical protein n=1 Tax=Streptomyces avermitilis TaxID=33903 RepID=UPI0036BE91B7